MLEFESALARARGDRGDRSHSGRRRRLRRSAARRPVRLPTRPARARSLRREALRSRSYPVSPRRRRRRRRSTRLRPLGRDQPGRHGHRLDARRTASARPDPGPRSTGSQRHWPPMLAELHRSTPMAARTLLQQALPDDLGYKVAGWLVALLDARAGSTRSNPAAGRAARRCGRRWRRSRAGA